MDGASQIVVPAFVSLLCICIVFIPMFFLDGVARFLFVPMAEAVMFAMVFSFILSRTLVPTMAKYLLKPHAAHVDAHDNVIDAPASQSRPSPRAFPARLRSALHPHAPLPDLLSSRSNIVAFSSAASCCSSPHRSC